MEDARANVSEIFASMQGEGLHVGRRHLFIRFGGCPLRCRYCDTPASLVPVPTCRVAWGDGAVDRHPNPLSVAEVDALVAARARSERRIHALAVTGGEPLAQADFLAAWLPERSLRVPVLLETAATLPVQLERVLPWVDIVSADIKLPSSTGERAQWEEHEACLRASRDRDLYVKLVVDEGTDGEEVEAGVRLVLQVREDIPVFLQPATAGSDGRLLIQARTLEVLYTRAVRAGADVRIVPQIHKMLGMP